MHTHYLLADQTTCERAGVTQATSSKPNGKPQGAAPAADMAFTLPAYAVFTVVHDAFSWKNALMSSYELALMNQHTFSVFNLTSNTLVQGGLQQPQTLAVAAERPPMYR